MFIEVAKPFVKAKKAILKRAKTSDEIIGLFLGSIIPINVKKNINLI
jgi:hypothetical protein